MRVVDFEWDEANLEHIAGHGVEPDEAEEAFEYGPVFRRTRHGYYLCFGRTEAGRHLTVVFTIKAGNVARIVTARDMSKREQKSYRRSRR